ncbi:hypothetical protein [Okeania sp. SIO2B9]|uniref:hypothetical protein n=1 Tax=Okeania sp. SIO2B9 TaxID=2607782 RepID=UPI00257BE6C6|nr:hypothetical protein [Okeania sp. SIO2B9]
MKFINPKIDYAFKIIFGADQINEQEHLSVSIKVKQRKIFSSSFFLQNKQKRSPTSVTKRAIASNLLLIF